MNRLCKGLLKGAGFLIVMVISVTAYAQRPEVKSVNKVVAGTGEILSINGSSFGTDATKLSVYFGAAKANVQSTTNQLLEVAVPPGTTYNTISVTNTTAGLTGYSKDLFLLSFGGAHPFDPAKLQAQVDFAAETGLYDLCSGDFDNDGKVDIAAANDGSSNSVSIMRNTSSGTGNINFSKLAISVSARTLQVQSGDLDGDGKLDLVFTEGTGALGDRLFVLRNTSAGPGSFTFTQQIITLTDHKNTEIRIADLDLDGKPELIVSDRGSGYISILKNTSAGSISFAAPQYIEITVPGSPVHKAATTDALDVADLNGDSFPEIVTSQFLTSSSNLYIIPNTSTLGNMAFGTILKFTAIGTVKRAKIGDLDGDGKPDIALTQLLGNAIAIFRNTSTGSTITLASPVTLTTEINPWGLDFSDLDGDGKADIVISHIKAKKLTILNNESTPGSFSFVRQPKDITYVTRHVKVGDLDGDGKPDIGLASIDDATFGPSSMVSILRNSTCISPVIQPNQPTLRLCDSALPYTLRTNVSRGAYYQWLKDGVPISCGVNLNTFNVTTVTGSGKYTVKILAEGATCATAGNCAIESPQIDVIIGTGTVGNPNPTSNGPVCLGSTLKLSIGTDVGATEYRWTGPDGYTGTGLNPPDVTNFQIENAGRYYVDVVLGTCIALQASVLVEAIDVPSFQITPGSKVLCQGDPALLLSVVPSPATFTYQWLRSGTPVGTGPTYSVTSVPASAGNYTVKASYSGCSTVETAPVTISIATKPVASFTAPTTACAGQQISFTNTSTVDNSVTATHAWNFGDGNTSTDTSPNHIFANSGTFNVTLNVSYDGACTSSAAASVNVTPAPPVAITNPQNDYTICPGESLTLEVLGTFTSYQWSTGATSSSISVSSGGNYSVNVTATNGCLLTALKEVNGLPAPGVLVSAIPDQIDEGQTSQLQAEGLQNYTWEPAETLNDPTSASPVATPLATTTYTVRGTDTNGCEGTSSIQVTVRGEAIVKKLTPGNLISPDIIDSKNDTWVVGDIQNYPQCGVVIYDDKGVKVFEAKPYNNDWAGTFHGKRLPDGVYFYIIRCDGEESTPRSGSITLMR